MIRIYLTTSTRRSEIESAARKRPDHFVVAPHVALFCRDAVCVELGSATAVRFFIALLVRAPGVISRAELIDILWGDCADGGPDYANDILSTIVFRLRAIAPAFGLVLETIKGRGISLREARVAA